MTIHTYHGTITAGITEFVPPCHFGSRRAALAAAAAKVAEAVAAGTPHPQAWLYDVTIDASKPPVIQDPGGAKPVVILWAIAQGSLPHRPGLSTSAESLRALLHRSLGHPHSRALGIEALDVLAHQFNTPVFAYPNVVEDPGAISYVTVQPGYATVTSREPIGDDGLRDGFLALSPDRQAGLRELLGSTAPPTFFSLL